MLLQLLPFYAKITALLPGRAAPPASLQPASASTTGVKKIPAQLRSRARPQDGSICPASCCHYAFGGGPALLAKASAPKMSAPKVTHPAKSHQNSLPSAACFLPPPLPPLLPGADMPCKEGAATGNQQHIILRTGHIILRTGDASIQNKLMCSIQNNALGCW